MTNTIELLETIGRDASLRHASVENLIQELDERNASASLKLAAASSNRSHLAQELGQRINMVVQVNHNPGAPDEDEEHGPDRDDDETDDLPIQDPER